MERLKTLFQTFDPARFDERNSRALGVSDAEREALEKEDMAMARAEALGAIMFGHEIVIPAGSAADSPAFVGLLGEIMGPSSEPRHQIASQNGGQHYSPFRLGFEPRFEKRHAKGKAFRSEYDHFVWDYLNSNNVANVDRRVLDALAAKVKRERAETLLLIGHAFLERRIDDIAGIDEGYADHVRWLEILYGNDGLQKAEPIYSPTDQFNAADRTLYSDPIGTCCESIKSFYSGASKILETCDCILAELDEAGLQDEARQRGFWYRRGDRFGQHWPVVRNWLDRRINDMFVSGYDIALPSYFSQPVETEGSAFKAAFAYVREFGGSGFEKGVGGEMLPQHPLDVDWKSVWELLAEPDVQTAQRILQDVLTSRRRDEIEDEKERIAAESDKQRTLRLADRAIARRSVVAEAIDTYVQQLNKGQSKIRLSANGRRAVMVTPEQSTSPILKRVGDLAGGAVVGTAGAPIAVSLWPQLQTAMQLGMTGGAGEYSASYVSNFATGGIWLGMTAVTAMMLGRVRRTPVLLTPKFAEAEKARVSLWMTSASNLLPLDQTQAS